MIENTRQHWDEKAYEERPTYWENSPHDPATRARLLRLLPDEWELLDWEHIFDLDSLEPETQRRFRRDPPNEMEWGGPEWSAWWNARGDDLRECDRAGRSAQEREEAIPSWGLLADDWWEIPQ